MARKSLASQQPCTLSRRLRRRRRRHACRHSIQQPDSERASEVVHASTAKSPFHTMSGFCNNAPASLHPSLPPSLRAAAADTKADATGRTSGCGSDRPTDRTRTRQRARERERAEPPTEDRRRRLMATRDIYSERKWVHDSPASPPPSLAASLTPSFGIPPTQLSLSLSLF